jgi:hypothetical protein
MNFSNQFIILNYIITNYEIFTHDIIFNESELKTEDFLSTDNYIFWHSKNIGTTIKFKKMLSGIIPLFRILEKPKKYYLNILINNNSDFLESSFYDIFFEKIRICVMISGFMRNYNLTLNIFKNFFKNYKVDYYVCTYDIIGIGNRTSDKYTNDKFDINDLKKIIRVKKCLIKEYSKCIPVSDNIMINKLFYQTSNVIDCYNMVNKNYMIYIRLRPDLIFEDLDRILIDHFDDIINNNIIVHGKKHETEGDMTILNDIPFDGFAMCNIITIDAYCRFHLHLNFKKYDSEHIESPEQLLYYYLIKNNIKLITDKICQINKFNAMGAINRIALLRRK